uniref:NADH-ubiquinone oxidoreductase chain 6 n=1 Tax=Donacia distincta TaxID=131636 RepID=U3L0D2_9CUCU|nr:NADH dehydrogenase subunit 6 [Donacia distincta]
MTMLMIMMLCSIMFLFMKHPLSLGFILLVQTILIALSTGLMNYNFWFSYILFLIMIGGMLILFIYMTSIASNEKFKFSSNLMMMFMFMFMLLISLNMISESFLMNLNMNISEISQQFNLLNFNKNFNKYLYFPSNKITYMIIIFLFITLIVTNKLTSFNMGPLRQSN